MIREQCLKCKHALMGGGCKAYPNGIPYEIANGTVSHDKVRSDQVGDFVFEKGLSEMDLFIRDTEPELFEAIKRELDES